MPWLQKYLGAADVLLLDASRAQLHAAKRIPGTVNVDLFSVGVQRVSAAEMEQRLQRWGIGPGRRIVIYDQGGGMMAPRLFFDLYYHGVPHYAEIVTFADDPGEAAINDFILKLMGFPDVKLLPR